MGSTKRSDATGKIQGRSVLEGAFGLLDVISGAQDGIGLSELARGCGLPKATVFRLVGQLVEIGAVQRYEHRYFVGSLLVRLGRSWQPHPRLRRIARGPVTALAASTRSAVAVTVLNGERVRMVTAALGFASESPWMQADSDLAGRTAAGQVLLATQTDGDPPDAFSTLEWRRLRQELRRYGVVVRDHRDVSPGVYCVAAPVSLPDGTGTASISALVMNRAVPPNLVDAVLRAADKIARDLVVR
jgi:DNA-binding IclR family transcriptional regulator